MKTLLAEIPVLVKHVTMAVLSKNPSIRAPASHLVPPGTGRADETFIASFSIAVAQLIRNGYLTDGSEPDGVVLLTGAGRIKNADHLKDDSGQAAAFDASYRSAFENSGTIDERQRDNERAIQAQKVAKQAQNRKAAAELLKSLNSPQKQGFKPQLSKRLRPPKARRVTRRRPPKGRV